MAPDDYSDLTREELLERLKALEGKPDAYSVELVSCGENRVAVIKVVNQLFGHALKEAMDLVDSAPCTVAKDLTEADADWICSMFNDAGAITRKIGSAAPAAPAAPAEPAPAAPAEPAPAPAEPAPAAPETEPVIIALSKLTEIEGGASVNMVLTVSGDYKANGLNAAIKYDPNVLTLKGVSVGKVLESFDDATVSLSYKSTPGTIRLIVMAGTEPITGRGALAKFEFEVAKNFYEASFVTPEIREFRAPNGANIEHSVSEGVLIPVEGAAPAPEPEKPEEPAPVTSAEPAPVTPAEPEPVKPEERPVHPVDGVSRPGGNSVNTRPVAPKPTEPEQTVIGSFSLSPVNNAKKGALFTTILSCMGGASAQELNATVRFNTKLLAFKQCMNGVAIANNYADLTVSGAVDTKEDTVNIKIAAPAGKTFKAEGDLIKLTFEVLNTTKDPAVLTLNVPRFGSTVSGVFRSIQTRTENGTVNFDHVERPADPTVPGPSPNKVSAEIAGSRDKSLKIDVVMQSDTTDKIPTENIVNGKGYNVLTSRIWNPGQVKTAQIIDFTGLSGILRPNGIRESDGSIIVESTVEKLSKSFSESASFSVGVGLFKASFSQSYKEKTNRSSEYAYSKIFTEFRGKSLTFTGKEWRSHLDQTFWKELNDTNVSPKTLFDTYGTHIICSAVYGGHMELEGVTEKRTKDTTKQIAASLSASIGWKGEQAVKKSGNDAFSQFFAAALQNGVDLSKATYNFNVGEQASQDKPGPTNAVDAQVQTEYCETESQSEDRLEFTGKTVGGGTSEVPKSLAEYTSVAAKWLKGLDSSSNWAFIGVPKERDDPNALHPVWELLPAGSARRAQLLNYFNEELAKNGSDLLGTPRYVTDVKFVWGKNESDVIAAGNRLVASPDRYVFDRHDLSHKFSGNGWLCLCYKTETVEAMRRNGHRPITNFFIYCDDKGHKQPTMGYPSSKLYAIKDYGWKRFEAWRDVQFKSVNPVSLRDPLSEDGIKLVFGSKGGVTLDGVQIKNKNNIFYIGDEWDYANDDLAGTVKNVSNLNHGPKHVFFGDGRFLMLCATRDERFTPVTAMSVYYDKDENEMIHESGEWLDIPERGVDSMDAIRCSTNAGTDAAKVYIAFKRAPRDERIDWSAGETAGTGRGSGDRTTNSTGRSTDTRTGSSGTRGSSTNTRTGSSGTRDSSTNTRTGSSGTRGSSTNTRGSSTNTRNGSSGTRGSSTNTRGSSTNTRPGSSGTRGDSGRR